jgi:hypothetical protein
MATRRRIALTLLVLPMAVCAQDWVPYANSEKGDKGSLDRATLVINGPVRKIWTMLERAEPVTFKGEPLKTWMALVEVHCDERKHRSLQEAGYDPDGAMIYEARFEGPARPIGAGTMGQIRLEAICGLR